MKDYTLVKNVEQRFPELYSSFSGLEARLDTLVKIDRQIQFEVKILQLPFYKLIQSVRSFLPFFFSSLPELLQKEGETLDQLILSYEQYSERGEKYLDETFIPYAKQVNKELKEALQERETMQKTTNESPTLEKIEMPKELTSSTLVTEEQSIQALRDELDAKHAYRMNHQQCINLLNERRENMYKENIIIHFANATSLAREKVYYLRTLNYRLAGLFQERTRKSALLLKTAKEQTVYIQDIKTDMEIARKAEIETTSRRFRAALPMKSDALIEFAAEKNIFSQERLQEIQTFALYYVD
ncbi:hypothetical protein HZB00_00845 [Candidatus Woesearchaeota archaeon]|nr:hypothetical protein [Candidatus Woesearchaeota archaeon]